MSLIARWRKRRQDMLIARTHEKLQEKQLHDVEKHTENLVLRSQIVAHELERRRNTDPWADTIARIARHES